ncbi:hypothetical protein KRR40_03580 [Niabella defluvii]|nr:hypothetical protein KRR40_03580 [Niabella sp. I65]
MLKRQEDKLSRYLHLPKQFVVDVDSLVKAARPGEITEIRITYDPNVPGTKTYLGVNLGNQVKRILKQYQLSAEGYDVMLICKDGYAPVRNATELLGTGRICCV